jgi:fructose-bisphosphate aldolase class 1
MSSLDLAEIVQALFTGDRGLLAMDESAETCNKRFAEVWIAELSSMRRLGCGNRIPKPTLKHSSWALFQIIS